MSLKKYIDGRICDLIKKLKKEKNLDTLEKRKEVIDNLLKKDTQTGKILIQCKFEALYENPSEKFRSDIIFLKCWKIESIDKDYSNIYLKGMTFGPTLSEFAGGATVGIIGLRTGGNESIHISYNRHLDIFNITFSSAENTYNSFGQFNQSKKIMVDQWENHDGRSLNNAFVGRWVGQNIKYDKLPTDILKIVNDNTFDEIYKAIWDSNHLNKIELNYNIEETRKKYMHYIINNEQNLGLINPINTKSSDKLGYREINRVSDGNNIYYIVEKTVFSPCDETDYVEHTSSSILNMFQTGIYQYDIAEESYLKIYKELSNEGDKKSPHESELVFCGTRFVYHKKGEKITQKGQEKPKQNFKGLDSLAKKVEKTRKGNSVNLIIIFN